MSLALLIKSKVPIPGFSRDGDFNVQFFDKKISPIEVVYKTKESAFVSEKDFSNKREFLKSLGGKKLRNCTVSGFKLSKEIIDVVGKNNFYIFMTDFSSLSNKEAIQVYIEKSAINSMKSCGDILEFGRVYFYEKP